MYEDDLLCDEVQLVGNLLGPRNSTEFEPEVNLIKAIIASGIHDKDVAYFYGQTFSDHCYYIGLDEEVTRSRALEVIYNE